MLHEFSHLAEEAKQPKKSKYNSEKTPSNDSLFLSLYNEKEKQFAVSLFCSFVMYM